MTETLLRTKLYIPPRRPNLVSRPRLIQRLNQGLQSDHKLTLISAPAGFGKTTVISEWLHDLGLVNDAGSSIINHQSSVANRFAWLSLDEEDNDPTRFLSYLVAALNQDPGQDTIIGEGALDMVLSPQPTPISVVLTALINDLAALPYRIVLILDDYHLVDSPLANDALNFLLKHLPSQLHIALVTREDPPLPLAQLRARGQLNELRAGDLRFSSGETTEFLNQIMGLGLPAEDIASLESRTEGWIAGLQLAAISMQGQDEVSTLVRSFTGSHRFVLDYLIEEVLETQPADIQEFLLQTAVLDRMCSPLCDALTGQNNSQATLEMLDHANLFVISLDEERRWYRYHHLFADLLRQRLHQTQSERLRTLHRRASDWYSHNGFPDKAVAHAIDSQDFRHAADLIAQYVDDVWQYAEHDRLHRWLARLPIEVLHSRPHLAILQAGVLLISGHMNESEQFIQAAEKTLDGESPPVSNPALRQTQHDKRKLRGRAAVIRAHLVSYYGDEQASIDLARQALDYLPEHDSTWRWFALDCMGTVYSGVDDTLAYQARSEALAASKTAGNTYAVLYASLRLVVTLRDLGHLSQAIEICEQQLAQAEKHKLSQTALVGWLYALWAEILAEKNELKEAQRLAAKGTALTAKGKDAILRGSSYLCLVRVLFSRGDLDDAEAIIFSVNHSPRIVDSSPWITSQLSAWLAKIRIVQNRLDDAAQWAERSEIDIDGQLNQLHDFDYAVLARILIAQGKLKDATKLLQRLYDAANAGNRTAKMIEILALQALAFSAAGDTARARAALESALVLAEPGGFIRVFVDEGPTMIRLLQDALTRGIAVDYTRQLVAAFYSHAPQSEALPQVSSDLIESLSERELEVLQLVAKGLTNQEIALQLFLTLNTVKSHTRSIYGKLDVHSRLQAVTKAKDMGLLI